MLRLPSVVRQNIRQQQEQRSAIDKHTDSQTPACLMLQKHNISVQKRMLQNWGLVALVSLGSDFDELIVLLVENSH